MKKYSVMTACIVFGLVLGTLVFAPGAPTSILHYMGQIVDETNDVLKISVTGWVDGLDLSEVTALTNTVHPLLNMTHTTSGTPAIGIGLEIAATQETTADNNEIIGSVGFVVDDETAATEDASFSVELMAAGAAKAEKFAVESTGVVTLVGGSTLDNATAATELLITETNIQLAGAVDLEGGNVKINEDSGDYDFAIETDSTDNAFSIDSGASTLDTNGVTVTFNQGSADVDFTVESNGNANAIQVDAGNDRVGILTAAPTMAFEVTGDSFLSGAVKYEACTIADGDATPDVSTCYVLTTSANTGATEITDLDNPVVGAIYIIIGGSATNSSTITDGGNFALSANFTASVDETLTLYVQADNDYVELSRATN